VAYFRRMWSEDDILTNLSKIGDLKVISRMSSWRIAVMSGLNAPNRQAARRRATLLEGSVPNEPATSYE